jgi:hypothetical protein
VTVEYNAALSMNNVTLRYSIYYGIGLHDDSIITHNNVSFSGNPSGNVYNFDTGEVSGSL